MLNPHTALTTGDSFFNDGAAAADAALHAQIPGLTSTYLNPAILPATPTWTHADLLSNFFNKNPVPDIDALWAHYSQWLAQPAGLPANFTVDDFATTADVDPTKNPLAKPVNGRLLFTVGCHSGLNVPDTLARPGRPRPTCSKRFRDWAQSYGAARGIGLRRQHGLRLRRHGRVRPLRAALRPLRQQHQLRRDRRRAVGAGAPPVLLGALELRRHRREGDDRGEHVRPAVLRLRRHAAAHPAGRDTARAQHRPAASTRRRSPSRASTSERRRPATARRSSPIRHIWTARRSGRGRWERCRSSTARRSPRPHAT